MKLTSRFSIVTGLGASALLIVSVPLAVVLSVPATGNGASVAGSISAAPRMAAALPAARVDMVIVPGVRLGPDKKLHDAFTPTDITGRVGQKIVVTVYNYDTGAHSITAPALNMNFVIPAATKNGVPVIKTFTFTVRKAGSYHWLCALPCDSDAKGWAMTHNNYMAGTIRIEPA